MSRGLGYIQPMKILISGDMEGVSGITQWDQVTPDHPEYMNRSRALYTGDLNAAIEGAYEGGATALVVSDGHWNGTNALIEQLDPRARLNHGSPSPLSMVQGIDQDVDALMLVGYHAMAGTAEAILDHTWSNARIANVFINGRRTGEIGLNLGVAGHFGVPPILITGDQTACAEGVAFGGEAMQTAIVKTATSQFAAECLSLVESRRRIREAAQAAVAGLKAGRAPKPFAVSRPTTLAVEFVYSRHADRALLFPGAARMAGTRVEVTLPDMLAAYRAFRAMATLARD